MAKKRKYKPRCKFCGTSINVQRFNGARICKECLKHAIICQECGWLEDGRKTAMSTVNQNQDTICDKCRDQQENEYNAGEHYHTRDY